MSLTRRSLFAAAAAPWLGAAAAHPRRRGFNLLEKFDRAHPRPFRESDFDIITGWGFDFVRLPLNYHIWTRAPGDYDEGQLREIDQAVAWGRARGIHVDLCLHTAPGYNVGDGEAGERALGLDLWGDGAAGAAALGQFVAQWTMFAERYRGVPAAALSFNLVNEPPEISAATYARVMAPAVAAIRAIDPPRPILCDGLPGDDGGRVPVAELIPLRVGQSTRGYRPLATTHYRAPWVLGSDMWPLPTWPVANVMNQFLFGDEKAAFQSPFTLALAPGDGARLDITVAYVSGRAQLLAAADGGTVLDRTFRPHPGDPQVKRLIDTPTPEAWQALYDLTVSAALPKGTRALTLRLGHGDWLTVSRLVLTPEGGAPIVIVPGLSAWPLRQRGFHLAAGRLVPDEGSATYGRAQLWHDTIEPWQAIERRGVFVHVGEWGVNKWTPHEVALAFMRDNLANWRRAGWGWALWQLRGESGPLDSGRTDAKMEPFRGHSLDRAMLDVLQAG